MIIATRTVEPKSPREIVAAFVAGAYYASLHGIGELGSDKGGQHWMLLKKWPAPRNFVPAPKPGKAFRNPFADGLYRCPQLVEIEGVWVERRWYVALRALPNLQVSANLKGWLRLKYDGGVGVLLGIDRSPA